MGAQSWAPAAYKPKPLGGSSGRHVAPIRGRRPVPVRRVGLRRAESEEFGPGAERHGGRVGDVAARGGEIYESLNAAAFL